VCLVCVPCSACCVCTEGRISSGRGKYLAFCTIAQCSAATYTSPHSTFIECHKGKRVNGTNGSRSSTQRKGAPTTADTVYYIRRFLANDSINDVCVLYCKTPCLRACTIKQKQFNVSTSLPSNPKPVETKCHNSQNNTTRVQVLWRQQVHCTITQHAIITHTHTRTHTHTHTYTHTHTHTYTHTHTHKRA